MCVRGGGSILSIVPLLPSFVSFSGQQCPALLLQGCPGPSAAVMRWGFGWGFGISVVGDPNASMPNVTLKSASSSLSPVGSPASAALRVADPTWWGQSAAQPMPTTDHACPVGVRCDCCSWGHPPLPFCRWGAEFVSPPCPHRPACA